jgi:hypothetical protein
MSRRPTRIPLHIEALESRALPASFALSLALDVACDGDPLQWAALHRELTSATGEQIQFWEQQRASDQILGVFHQRPESRAEEALEDRGTGESPVKSPEYCEAIDGMIEEIAASEIIRYLDHQATVQQMGPQYEALVDQALRQLPASAAEPGTAD